MVALLFISAITFAQKKEITTAAPALSKANYVQALLYLDQAEPMLAAADQEQKAHFYVIKGEAMIASANKTDYGKLKKAGEALLKAEELDTGNEFSDRIATAKNNLRIELVNSAIDDQKKSQWERAANKLVHA